MALLLELKRNIQQSVHCICHRLALACTDSNKDCKIVTDTSDILRHLWKVFEDSPKRTATLIPQLLVETEQESENEQLTTRPLFEQENQQNRGQSPQHFTS
ncbi:Hypothetical predicted protein [Mytilus galloprovincialis]|uniref:Uncharacterized protein n=1 Tax=Mytilus galloprovincialis TaxID=29158 RepID=A0A8B6GRR2_MYTGA|nr:Hypothetical predicted protein [Mytilus galloprovincialis]